MCFVVTLLFMYFSSSHLNIIYIGVLLVPGLHHHPGSIPVMDCLRLFPLTGAWVHQGQVLQAQEQLLTILSCFDKHFLRPLRPRFTVCVSLMHLFCTQYFAQRTFAAHNMIFFVFVILLFIIFASPIRLFLDLHMLNKVSWCCCSLSITNH